MLKKIHIKYGFTWLVLGSVGNVDPLTDLTEAPELKEANRDKKNPNTICFPCILWAVQVYKGTRKGENVTCEKASSESYPV